MPPVIDQVGDRSTCNGDGAHASFGVSPRMAGNSVDFDINVIVAGGTDGGQVGGSSIPVEAQAGPSQ